MANQSLSDLTIQLQQDAAANADKLVFNGGTITGSNNYLSLYDLIGLSSFTVNVSNPETDIVYNADTLTMMVKGDCSLYGLPGEATIFTMTGVDVSTASCQFSSQFSSFNLDTVLTYRLIPDGTASNAALSLFTFSNAKLSVVAPYKDSDGLYSLNSADAPDGDPIPLVPALGLYLSEPGLAFTRDISRYGLIEYSLVLKGTVMVGPMRLYISLIVPVSDSSMPDIWKLNFTAGKGEQAVSLENLIEVLAGNNPFTLLPSSLSILGDFSLLVLTVDFDFTDPSNPLVATVFVNIGTGEGDWPVVTTPVPFDLTNVGFSITLTQPFNTLNGDTQVYIYGGFLVGKGTSTQLTLDAGVILDITTGDWVVSISGELKSNGFDQLYLSLPLTSGSLPPDMPSGMDTTTITLNYLTIGYNASSSSNSLSQIAFSFSSQNFVFPVIPGVVTAANPYANFNISNPTSSSNFQLTGIAGAELVLVNTVFDISAAKPEANGGWIFSGSLATGNEISLGNMVSTFMSKLGVTLPLWIRDSMPVIQELAFQITTPPASDKDGANSYSITGVAAWPAFNYYGIKVDGIEADVQATYDANNKVLTGTIAGFFTIDNLVNVKVGYSFAPNNADILLEIDDIICTYNTTTKIITISFDKTSLGGIITNLMETIEPGFQLPFPWNFLNDIDLSGLSMTINLDKTSSNYGVSLSYNSSIDLGFLKINSFTISKTTSANVTLAIDGSFLGISTSDPKSDFAKPQPMNNLPPVPGQGNSLFSLNLLALGQHVAIAGAADFQNVSDVITALGSIEAPSGTLIPLGVGSTPVYYDPHSNWLMATDFGILQIPETSNPPVYCIAASAVFNDPNIYGFQLTLSGDKMKFLKGLSFQILYKKISDTVGLYQADLTLPSAVRNLNFGEFNIVIPSIGVQIYTNGDFLVDIGFPYNMDFSRSFTVNAIIWVGPIPIPVMGSAGFYFGMLSSATCPQVPQSTKGSFNPVIVFGIGAQIGFGYTANYGILSAGFSLTALGILEGIIATWQPYNYIGESENQTDVSTSYYFWIKGTIGVMGKLWGTIDFSIVKATIDLTISATVSTTYESYMPMPFSFTVRVSVTVSVKINLGLFSVTIHFSFRMTISESLTIGSNTSSQAPWYDGSAAAQLQASRMSRRLAATAIRQPLTLKAQEVAEKTTLSIYFIPHLTVTGSESGTLAQQVAQYVAMLYIDTLPDGETPTGSTSFEELAMAVFNWVTTSYVSGAGSISASQLDDLYQQLCNTTTPIDVNSILAFLDANFILNIQALDTSSTEEQSMHVTVFPMISSLQLSVPAYNDVPAVAVDFKNYTQCDSEYITSVQDYFTQMMMQTTSTDGTQVSKTTRTVNEGAPVSVATIVFEDYFLLIARQLVNAASNAMESYSYTPSDTDSLQSIVATFNAMGTEDAPNDLTIAALSAANGDAVLGSSLSLWVYDIQYTIITGDTPLSLAVEFGLQVSQLAMQNESVNPLLNAGVPLLYNGTTYTTKAEDTFDTVAKAFGVSLAVLTTTGCSMNNQQALLSAGVTLMAGTTAYVVKAGDTFASIATQFGLTVPALATQNATLTQLLVAASPVFYKGWVYVVQPTDTLATVAARFGTDTTTMMAMENDVFSSTALFTAGALLLIAGAGYQVQAADTLGSIQAAFASMSPVSVGDMLLQNCFLPGLILANVSIAVSGQPTYTTLPGDTISSILNAFPGVSTDTLAASMKDIQNLMRAQSLFYIPPMVYATATDNTSDTLQSVASRFQTQTAKLTTVPANQQSAGFFATGASISVPDLQSLSIALLSEQVQGGTSIGEASGMVSRYLMHGLRLPLNEHIHFTSPSPYAEDADCSLYNLTGQQFLLPSSFTGLPYTISLTNPSPGDGIEFNGSSTDSELKVTLQASDETTIASVLGFAKTTGMLPQVTSLIELPPYGESAANFTFRASVPWQPGAELVLPTGGTVPRSVTPEIWSFPSGITQAVNADKLLLPLMVPYLSAGGDTENDSQISTYGWGTLLNVTIRKSADAPDYCYELVGADETGTQLLQNLLSFMNGEDNSVVSALAILYPDSSGGAYLSDGNSNIVSFLLQSNLSTVTNPPQASSQRLMVVEESTPPTGILNDNFDFLKLLWECSITRSGGFNIYYNVFENNTGFPATLFQDSSSAVINVLVTYKQPIGNGIDDQLHNFMNCLVSGVSIDPTKDVVYAQSQLQTTGYTVPTPGGDTTNDITIADIVSLYNLLPSDLILDNPTAPLNNEGLDIYIPSVYYQMKNGDTLESVATYFSQGAATTITAAQLQSQNPGVTPETWALLYIGDITLVTGTGGPASIVQSVLDYYGITADVFAVANLNLEGLFANGTGLLISDQMVSRTSVIPAGSAGYWMSRIVPAEVPVSTTDPLYPNLYLQNAYNQLAATVLGNASFKAGTPGMPVGPSDDDPDQSQRITDVVESDVWEYSQAIPFNTYAVNRGMVNVTGLPDDISNPYAGVGNRVQVNLDWRDLFGNYTVTPFSDPQLGSGTILNNVPVQVAYTDNLLPISAWPGATTYYVVQKNAGDPQMQIGLLFDTARYTVAGNIDAATAQANAQQDIVAYTSIYYQLCQVEDPQASPVVPTISAVVSTSLLSSAYTMTDTQFYELLDYVKEAYLFLDAVAKASATPPAAPSERDFIIPLTVSGVPATCIFEVLVSWSIVRQISQVHDDFKDVVSVWNASSAVQVPTMPNNSNITTLDSFAAAFEDAMRTTAYQLKIATGMPDVTGATANGQSIWSVQWGLQANQPISISVTDAPVYYAIAPLANYLQSDAAVPVFPYTTGQGIHWDSQQNIAISGVDMDTWASTCLNAIETLLSAQYSAPMYLLAEIAGGGADYQAQLLACKKSLADTIRKQLTNILATQPATGTPLNDAEEQMYQQLLNNLTNAYTISAVIQFPVAVSAPYPGQGETIAPNLYGVPVTSKAEGDTSDTSPVAPYSVSTAKVALAGNTASFLTFMFNVNTPGNQSSFEFGLQYQVTHLEYGVKAVPGIADYKGSQWLNFVLQPAATAIGEVTVPVLLRAYPTPPSTLTQTFTQLTPITTLQEAREWSYGFTYASSHEAQDSIDAVVELNLRPLVSVLMAAEETPNLLHELTEFTHVYARIQQDLVLYLPQITRDTKTSDSNFINAQAAVIAFLQLIARISNAWPYWQEAKNTFYAPNEVAQVSFEFVVTEKSLEQDNPNTALVVALSSEESIPAGLQWPLVSIEGYINVPDEPAASYTYENKNIPLTFSEAQKIPDRNVTFTALDILQFQNAWASVSLKRNAELLPGIPTNSDFVYQTPFVSFANRLVPLLSCDQPIDIATMNSSGTVQQATLLQHLVNLFSTLFEGDTSSEELIKLGCTYYYAINTAIILPEVQVPVLLATPFDLSVPSDYTVPPGGCPESELDEGPLVCVLNSAIQQWLLTNVPLTTNGRFVFSIVLFSANQLPVLQLNELVLNTSDIVGL
jgi:LysM repeat protein